MITHPNGSFGIRSGLRAGEMTVYGSEECGWTQKQREYLNQKKMAYNFVDCSQNQCPAFVDGYPTIVLDKKIYNGFTEF